MRFKPLLLFKKPVSFIGGQVKWKGKTVIGNKTQQVPVKPPPP